MGLKAPKAGPEESGIEKLPPPPETEEPDMGEPL